LSEADLILIATISGLSLLIIGLLFNQFKATSFDPGFARSIGIPSQFFHYLLMLLLAWAVVSALQAVGVVLVSALLIIPAATAYLLSDRLHHMLIISVVVGMVSAGLGAFFSFLGPSLPTGPFIILSAAVIFALAFGFAPRYGVFPRWKRHREQRLRIQRENTLKALFHRLESGDFSSKWVTAAELAELRRRTPEETKRDIAALERRGLGEFDAVKSRVRLTERGFERASKIVRNHRLWELYLTNAANIAPDHVHADAEIIEHILGEEIVRELEKALDQPTEDPHGKAIPQTSL
jgi:manganese/zinc/iron transport system permease protein